MELDGKIAPVILSIFNPEGLELYVPLTVVEVGTIRFEFVWQIILLG